MERWSDEKREIFIEDCDPEIPAVVVDYMYGIGLPKLVVSLTSNLHKYNTSLYVHVAIIPSLNGVYF